MEISRSNKDFVPHACKANFQNYTGKDKILKQTYHKHSEVTCGASLLWVFCVFLFQKKSFWRAGAILILLNMGSWKLGTLKLNMLIKLYFNSIKYNWSSFSMSSFKCLTTDLTYSFYGDSFALWVSKKILPSKREGKQGHIFPDQLFYQISSQ